MTSVEREGISVIVCTRDRTDLLEGCLQAIAAQDYRNFEVLVIDNAPSTDLTASLCATLPVRYFREPRPGLSRARNRGIREARHPILAFTDDDAIPDRDWLTALANAFADATVMAVTGRVEANELRTPAQQHFERGAGGMSKGMEVRAFHRDTLSDAELIAVQAVGVGANMAFRAAGLARVGPFDVRLGLGTPARGAEDLEMFNRILRAGLLLRYEPAAVVRHRHRHDLAGLRQQLFDAGCGFGVYLISLYRGGGMPRWHVLRYAFGSWMPWLVGRLGKGAVGRHPLPWSLLWAQFAGALKAPVSYRAAQSESP